MKSMGTRFNNRRHFSIFRLYVTYSFHIAGYEYSSSYETHVCCAFALRHLKALVRIGEYLPAPSRFWDHKIEITYIKDVEPSYPNPEYPCIKYTNIDQINAQLVRGIIWDLAIQSVIGFNYEEITNSCDR